MWLTVLSDLRQVLYCITQTNKAVVTEMSPKVEPLQEGSIWTWGNRRQPLRYSSDLWTYCVVMTLGMCISYVHNLESFAHHESSDLNCSMIIHPTNWQLPVYQTSHLRCKTYKSWTHCIGKDMMQLHVHKLSILYWHLQHTAHCTYTTYIYFDSMLYALEATWIEWCWNMIWTFVGGSHFQGNMSYQLQRNITSSIAFLHKRIFTSIPIVLFHFHSDRLCFNL